MDTNNIDLTGLTPQQVAQIKEIVKSFRENSSQPLEEKVDDEDIKNKLQSSLESLEDEELNSVHEEFSWLVADLGVKTPLTRSQIYDS